MTRGRLLIVICDCPRRATDPQSHERAASRNFIRFDQPNIL